MDGFDFNDSGFWMEPDFILSDIISTLVNGLGVPIGVTLFMKGMIMSGLLVSESEYLQTLSDVFNKVTKTPDGERVTDLFDFTGLTEGNDLMEMIPPDSDDDNDEYEPEEQLNFIEEMPPPIRHLHLKEVAVLSPHPPLIFDQSMMPIIRIRLVAVDGWMLGQAHVDEDHDALNGGNGKSSRLH